MVKAFACSIDLYRSVCLTTTVWVRTVYNNILVRKVYKIGNAGFEDIPFSVAASLDLYIQNILIKGYPAT